MAPATHAEHRGALLAVSIGSQRTLLAGCYSVTPPQAGHVRSVHHPTFLSTSRKCTLGPHRLTCHIAQRSDRVEHTLKVSSKLPFGLQSSFLWRVAQWIDGKYLAHPFGVPATRFTTAGRPLLLIWGQLPLASNDSVAGDAWYILLHISWSSIRLNAEQ